MIRGTTQVCAVWGWPVKHSASPAMHNAAFAALGLDLVYVPFSIAPESLEAAVAGVRALGLRGVNVTVPLKEQVAPYLDQLTDRAQRLGAVNTLFWDGEALCGDSTDGPGFLAALAKGGVPPYPGMKALVLGAGGSARAIVDALVQAGAEVTIANRTLEKAEEVATRFGAKAVIPLSEGALCDVLPATQLLVNTTSIGMSPHAQDMPPVPAEALHPQLFVTDLIYNPAQTRLLALADAAGCQTQNGVEMLVQQGAIAFSRWTGHEAPLAEMRQAVEHYLQNADTIVRVP